MSPETADVIPEVSIPLKPLPDGDYGETRNPHIPYLWKEGLPDGEVPKPSELMWLAGYLEMGASFCMVVTGQQDNRRGRHVVRTYGRPRLSMADSRFPERIGALVERFAGNGHHIDLESTFSGKPYTSYRWMVTDYPACELVDMIVPYLVLKKSEADYFNRWGKNQGDSIIQLQIAQEYQEKFGCREGAEVTVSQSQLNDNYVAGMFDVNGFITINGGIPEAVMVFPKNQNSLAASVRQKFDGLDRMSSVISEVPCLDQSGQPEIVQFIKDNPYWRVCGEDARNFLKRISPSLWVQREMAEQVLLNC